jgi:hypothetical protein
MQRDYVLRMIEQAAAALKAALARARGRNGSRGELTLELRRASQLGGLDFDLLRVCDVPTIMQMVAPSGEPDPARTWLAAEALFVDASAAAGSGADDEAGMLFAKARLLYGMIAPTAILPTAFPEIPERLREIDEWPDPQGAA